MRSANALCSAEFCARQYESRSCALVRGIDLYCRFYRKNGMK